MVSGDTWSKSPEAGDTGWHPYLTWSSWSGDTGHQTNRFYTFYIANYEWIQILWSHTCLSKKYLRFGRHLTIGPLNKLQHTGTWDIINDFLTVRLFAIKIIWRGKNQRPVRDNTLVRDFPRAPSETFSSKAYIVRLNSKTKRLKARTSLPHGYPSVCRITFKNVRPAAHS